jgi:hypothetical protein
MQPALRAEHNFLPRTGWTDFARQLLVIGVGQIRSRLVGLQPVVATSPILP